MVTCVALLASFALAAMSYHIIESPARRLKTKNPKKACLLIASVVTVMTISIFLLSNYTAKTIQPTLHNILASASQTNFRCPIGDHMKIGNSKACLLFKGEKNRPSVAILGNSHAQMYAPAIKTHLEKNINYWVSHHAKQLPTYSKHNVSQKCSQLADANIRTLLLSEDIKIVIIGTTWYKTAYQGCRRELA